MERLPLSSTPGSCGVEHKVSWTPSCIAPKNSCLNYKAVWYRFKHAGLNWVHAGCATKCLDPVPPASPWAPAGAVAVAVAFAMVVAVAMEVAVAEAVAVEVAEAPVAPVAPNRPIP